MRLPSSVLRRLIAVPAVLVLLAAAGCGVAGDPNTAGTPTSHRTTPAAAPASGTPPAGGPTSASAAPPAAAPPSPTATAPDSPTASDPPPVAAPPAEASPFGDSSQAAPPPAPPVSDPAAPADVVNEYFQAINDGDYTLAWQLFGGASSGQSYDEFSAGFADTDHDEVTVLGTNGDTVSINLTAYQSDGSVKQYTGTYTVQGGTIVGTDVTQTNKSDTCGAPSNPYGYTFCDVGTLITSAPSGFCEHFDCIANFPNGRGYVVQCADGMFSASGGIDGACSDHGDVKQRLYTGS